MILNCLTCSKKRKKESMTVDQEPITDVEVLQSTEIVSVLDGSSFEQTLERLKGAADRFFKDRLTEAKNSAAIAKALKVSDADSYKQAGELRSVIAGKKRELAETLKPMKQRADSVKAILTDNEKVIGNEYNEVLTSLDPQLDAYETEQRRLAEIERQKNQKALDKQAEKDRQKQARELLEQGKDEAAEDLLNRPLVTTAVKARPDIPSVAGQSSRETYDYELVDLIDLAKAVVNRKVPVTYICDNRTILGPLSRNLKEQFNVPGCKLIKKTVRTSR